MSSSEMFTELAECIAEYLRTNRKLKELYISGMKGSKIKGLRPACEAVKDAKALELMDISGNSIGI